MPQGRARIEEYEEEGRRLYHPAARRDYAREQALSDIFMALHGNFGKGKSLSTASPVTIRSTRAEVSVITQGRSSFLRR